MTICGRRCLLAGYAIGLAHVELNLGAISTEVDVLKVVVGIKTYAKVPTVGL